MRCFARFLGCRTTWNKEHRCCFMSRLRIVVSLAILLKSFMFLLRRVALVAFHGAEVLHQFCWDLKRTKTASKSQDAPPPSQSFHGSRIPRKRKHKYAQQGPDSWQCANFKSHTLRTGPQPLQCFTLKSAFRMGVYQLAVSRIIHKMSYRRRPNGRPAKHAALQTPSPASPA